MRNGYVTKYLCITLASSMLVSGTSAVSAEDAALQTEESAEAFADETGNVVEASGSEGEEYLPEESETENSGAETAETESPEPAAEEIPEVPMEELPQEEPEETVTATPEETVTPVPEETLTPVPEETVTPAPEETLTPAPEETVTPEPEETVTPTPEETATPTPDIDTKKVNKLIKKIKKLLKLEAITLEQEEAILEIRKKYDALTEEEKGLVSNYAEFLTMEEEYLKLKEEARKIELAESYPKNLHAGNAFDPERLKENYHLTFSQDFSQIMTQIEAEYQAENGITDGSDSSSVTTSADTFLVRNWQDVLAVFVYQQYLQGKTEYVLDSSCKEVLYGIFKELNPVITDAEIPEKRGYAGYSIYWYMKKHQISESDGEILKKYVETDCKLLCAISTRAKGFIRQSIGENAAEERVNVIETALSLVGKVDYFWGGKSSVIGWDSRWGGSATVEMEGSPTTGTVRPFGLDCSGFVAWAVINGYQNAGMEAAVGCGTSSQWEKSYMISEGEAKPGDLVFQRGPEAESKNHVGIICGKTSGGDWIVVHCNGSKNGVSVDEAYGSGFRYIRCPYFYPDQSAVENLLAQNTVKLPDEEPENEKPETSDGNSASQETEELYRLEIEPIIVPTQEEEREPEEVIPELADEFAADNFLPEEAGEYLLISGGEVVYISQSLDDFILKIEIPKEIPVIDSSSEFFVGPVMPDVIPTFGPDAAKETIFFGPQLPEEMVVSDQERMLAEEIEMK